MPDGARAKRLTLFRAVGAGCRRHVRLWARQLDAQRVGNLLLQVFLGLLRHVGSGGGSEVGLRRVWFDAHAVLDLLFQVFLRVFIFVSTWRGRDILFGI